VLVAVPYEVDAAFKEDVQPLCQALIACCNDPDRLVRFLRDLLSVKEAHTLRNRWVIAQLLLQGRSQVEVAQQLRISSKTISKVYQWVYGPFVTGGYAEVYQRLQEQTDDR
jgi:uncharacterized protein YerC